MKEIIAKLSSLIAHPSNMRHSKSLHVWWGINVKHTISYLCHILLFVSWFSMPYANKILKNVTFQPCVTLNVIKILINCCTNKERNWHSIPCRKIWKDQTFKVYVHMPTCTSQLFCFYGTIYFTVYNIYNYHYFNILVKTWITLTKTE